MTLFGAVYVGMIFFRFPSSGVLPFEFGDEENGTRLFEKKAKILVLA